MSIEETQSRKALARSKAQELFGSAPEVFENPLTVLASPAWRGIEGEIWLVNAGDKSAILKHYHSDIEFYVETSAAIEAAQQAGQIGVGPKVLDAWNVDAVVAFENLSSPWRAGGLHDAVDLGTRSKVIDCKKSFQSNAILENDANIFEEIDQLFKTTQDGNMSTHNDVAVFMEFFHDAKAKIAALGSDTVPCHRDGNTANIMVHPDGSVKLIDFDLAANCDPFEDIGCHLIEYFESDVEARSGFEEWYGNFDEGLFQRAMLYGLADDMRWGLIGAIMAAKSLLTSLEFSKYSAWRFIRLEMQVKRSQANDRIRAAV